MKGTITDNLRKMLYEYQQSKFQPSSTQNRLSNVHNYSEFKLIK